MTVYRNYKINYKTIKSSFTFSPHLQHLGYSHHMRRMSLIIRCRSFNDKTTKILRYKIHCTATRQQQDWYDMLNC